MLDHRDRLLASQSGRGVRLPERHLHLPSQPKRGPDRLSSRRWHQREVHLAAFHLYRRRCKRLRLRAGNLYVFLTPHYQGKVSEPASGQVMIGH